LSYYLGNTSNESLQGINDALYHIPHRAIEITTQDFSVIDGLRTREEQRIMVDSGASKTMNSEHIPGRAIDLAPYLNGRNRWEWALIYPMAKAVRDAAIEQEVLLTWGAVWDRCLNDLVNLEAEVEKYIKRRKRVGKKAFLDGVHFQLRK
jgi:peptidoglycan L-alanyl-D-glutamate endopeptidase CwlK